MDTYYIFGDIEGNVEIYGNTVECIQKNWANGKFIFLGDIYTSENLHTSIDMVKNLTTYFFQHEDIITNDSEPLDIIRLFRKIWKDKGLKSYNTTHRQYWRSIPKKEKQLENEFKYKFIFGNKEIEFLFDILNSKNISKIKCENDEAYFHIPIKYLNTKTKNEEETTRIYSCNQLNIMYNYLSNCNNYFIDHKTLYTHCYFNCNKMKDIENVVAGHNKGYGKFRDTKYEKITVYIVDLTSRWKNLNNYIIWKNNEFQLFNEEMLPEGLSTIESWSV